MATRFYHLNIDLPKKSQIIQQYLGELWMSFKKLMDLNKKKLIHTSWLFSHCLFWSSCVKKKELNFKPKWFSNLQNLSKKDASLWILEESFTPYLNTATGENLSFFFRQILDCQKIDVCVHDDDQISMTWKASKNAKIWDQSPIYDVHA